VSLRKFAEYHRLCTHDLHIILLTNVIFVQMVSVNVILHPWA